MLTAEQLAGRAPLPSPLPLTGGVERAFLDRYRRLPEPAQRFLLVAAADDTGRLTVVRDAAERLDAGDDALDAVERAGLLRVDGDDAVPVPPAGALGGLPGGDQRAAARRAPGAGRRARRRRRPAGVAPGRRHRPAGRRRSSPRSTPSPSGPPPAAGTRRRPRRGPAPPSSPPTARTAAGGCTWPRRRRGWARTRRGRRRWPSAAAADVTDPLLRARLLTAAGTDRVEHPLAQRRLRPRRCRPPRSPPAWTRRWPQQLAMLAASLSAFGARSPPAVRPGRAGRRARAGRAAPVAGRVRTCCTGSARVARAGLGGRRRGPSGRAFALTDADPLEATTCCSPTWPSPRG